MVFYWWTSYLVSRIWNSYLLSRGVIEKIANRDKDHSWTNILAVGILAYIGLGFFTGGLLHFPDSPARSLWVVPVGFSMSLIAMYLMNGKEKVKIKSAVIYGAISITTVIVGSFYALHYFNEHGSDSHSHWSRKNRQIQLKINFK